MIAMLEALPMPMVSTHPLPADRPVVVVGAGASAWDHPRSVHSPLDLFVAALAATGFDLGRLEFVVPDEPGVAASIRTWCSSNAIAVSVRAIDWKGPCQERCQGHKRRCDPRLGHSYCPYAGLFANQAMITPRPWHVLTWPGEMHVSTLAVDLSFRARLAGIPVIEFPAGELQPPRRILS